MDRKGYRNNRKQTRNATIIAIIRDIRKSVNRVGEIKFKKIMKKLKKLVLKKDVITSLSNSEMSTVKGGCSRYDLFSCAIDMSIYPGAECPITTGTVDTYPGPDPDPYPITGRDNTCPPRCCDYGCCETVNC